MEKINKLTYTVPEMAQALGLGRNTAYDLVNRADFPAIRVGGKILVPIEALNNWLNRQASQGGAR